MAPNLPQIRVSDIDLLNDWDLSNVKAFSDSIPGYRSGASTFIQSIHHHQCLDLLYIRINTPTTQTYPRFLLSKY